MEAMSSHEKEDETSAPAGVKLKKTHQMCSISRSHNTLELF